MAAWKTTRTGTANDGSEVQMRYAEFGKGRAKIRQWKIYRDGAQVDYAVNAEDAEENFQRALIGAPNGRDGSRLDLAGEA